MPAGTGIVLRAPLNHSAAGTYRWHPTVWHACRSGGRSFDISVRPGTRHRRRERMGLTTRKAGMVLWIVQGLLALVFLFAGGMKLVMPLEELTKGAPVQLPGLFLRFIGVCEVLGAIGLIVPGLVRI